MKSNVLRFLFYLRVMRRRTQIRGWKYALMNSTLPDGYSWHHRAINGVDVTGSRLTNSRIELALYGNRLRP